MTYRITYFSPEGHVRKLGEAIRSLLPPDTPMVPLREAESSEADVYLLGFELQFRELDRLPKAVEDFLRSLSGKQVFLFATVPFWLDDAQRNRIHSSVNSAIPRECDYRGMFLCSGHPDPMLLEGFRHAAVQKPESTRIRHWLKRCEAAVGHPNEHDMEKIRRFAHHVLQLHD